MGTATSLRRKPQDSACFQVGNVASREWSLISHPMRTLALPGGEVKEMKN
jgi:hypothetical protein